MSVVVSAIMPTYAQTILKITGAHVYSCGELAVTSPLYGAGMVLDGLEEMWAAGLIAPNDSIVLIGSMGSLTNAFSLGEVVLPNPSLCNYYGFEGREIYQDGALMKSLVGQLKVRGLMPVEYRHGSSFAVFDPHTDHHGYTTSLYEASVVGVDCGEVFIGQEFAQRKDLRAAAMLYCSDTPLTHIADLGEQEFSNRAIACDLLLNTVAAWVLNRPIG